MKNRRKHPIPFIVAVRQSPHMTPEQKAYWEGVVKIERAERKRARKQQRRPGGAA